MKESHDFKYKRDFSNFCRFSIKISFANFLLQHSVFYKWIFLLSLYHDFV